MDNMFGCVLGKHDETGRKEQAIYYLSKKFTPYESLYTHLGRMCCYLTWITQKLRHYMSSYIDIPYVKDGRIEVHFRESDVDRKVS